MSFVLTDEYRKSVAAVDANLVLSLVLTDDCLAHLVSPFPL